MSVYNCKVFCYANGKQQIRFYGFDIHEKDSITEKIQEKRSLVKELLKDNNYDVNKEFSAYVSKNRTINNIYSITRSNVWDYFITMTFDAKRVDRYDYDACMKSASEYFKFLKRMFAKDLYYILVPEQHKDGAWHIHGLIGGSEGLNISYSGHNDKKGRKIYHLPSYIYGFSDCTKISHQFAACSYMTKYVTKDLCFETMYRNRYICSKNINVAKEKKYRISKDRFYDLLNKMENINFVKTVDDGENFVIYLETEGNENYLDFVYNENEFTDL